MRIHSSSPQTAIYKGNVGMYSFFMDIFLFLVGGLSQFFINAIGQLYIGEIILMTVLPFLLLTRSGALRNFWVKRITLFGIIWLVSQIITDLIRSTPVSDMARGWASITVFILSFLALFILIGGNVTRLKIYTLGVCLGGFLHLIFQPEPYFDYEPWKFGFGPVVTLLVFLIVVASQKKKFTKAHLWFLPLVLLGGVSFYLNARSLGAFTILTAIIMVLVTTKPVVRLMKKSYQPGRIVVLGLLIISFGFGLIKLYETAATNNWLGEVAKQKYEAQTGGAFGLILAGRAEILSSVQAVLDSPIIGHGSWATGMKYRLYLYTLRDLGYNISLEQIGRSVSLSDLIPTHSHLFQNWVWAGLLGAIFWIVILLLIAKSFLASIRTMNPLYVLVVYFSILSVWDILFSPFGSIMRLEWALRLVVFITAITLSAKTTKPKKALI